jgi:hypothetical protein
MKLNFLITGAIAGIATLLAGCGDSKPTETPSTSSAAPPPPIVVPTNATASVSTPEPAAKPAAAPPVTPPSAPTIAQQVATVGADITTEFAKNAREQLDPQLKSLGAELTDKVKAMVATAPSNTSLQSQLMSPLTSLANGGQDAGALASVYQVAQAASLTPQQLQLAKDMGNIASAYVVQKNFASLDGLKSEVATVVNSLRKGDVTPAIPAIQKVAQSASLTPTQKQLLSSVADKYAPGALKATETLQKGLQTLQGLGGTSK